MATPRPKHPELSALLDSFTRSAFGTTRSESIQSDLCVSCCKAAVDFRDELSRREYTISGLCQKCQDSFFGSAEED